MRMTYSKLHASLVGSSLWTESDATRILFLTLLAMCDKEGFVAGTKKGLTRIANLQNADEAWEALMSEDPDSSDYIRAPENKGRRVAESPGGFTLINYPYYRDLRDEDDRREKSRGYQAAYIERKKKKGKVK